MRYYVISMAILLCAGCVAQPKPEATLFQRIGGLPMLSRLSNQTLDIVSKDPRTSRSFEGVKMKTLKESVTNFLCVKTGGNCVYEGETMKKSHADLHNTVAEFEIMVDVLRERMDANGVGTREKNELLRILAPMKYDVVTD
ncbi:group 1 truncated hemoglobin [Methylophilus sp. Leaf414]|uniref:group I truncated hemoglobin n=1 Tax=Methylophilus sp. Leaf414 TaxID=1736371 RepID=UPI0006FF4C07|nr:group 1 truncated hemoglobin [Methylophilus sp. Leaf414]KQT36605.1 globin [Methylophilus sp. Leaf414]